MSKPQTIIEYTKQFPNDVQQRLEAVHAAIANEIPEAVESISYGMPTFKINNRPLIYYGAFASHIGLYATPDGHAEFEEELSKYKRGKGSVQFPYSQPLPVDLITRITAFRAQQVKEK